MVKVSYVLCQSYTSALIKILEYTSCMLGGVRFVRVSYRLVRVSYRFRCLRGIYVLRFILNIETLSEGECIQFLSGRLLP